MIFRVWCLSFYLLRFGFSIVFYFLSGIPMFFVFVLVFIYYFSFFFFFFFLLFFSFFFSFFFQAEDGIRDHCVTGVQTCALPIYENKIREKLKFCRYAPIVFVSALTGRRCPSVLEAVDKVYKSGQTRIKTSDLNKMIETAMEKNTPPIYRDRKSVV